jgi:hypothetical protein
MAENEEEKLVQGRLDLNPSDNKESCKTRIFVVGGDSLRAKIVQAVISGEKAFSLGKNRESEEIPQHIVAVTPDTEAVKLDVETLGDEYRATALKASEDHDKRVQRRQIIASQKASRVQARFIDDQVRARGGKKEWDRSHR